MIVAVDGPVAAGKGTLARRLADHFGLAYLDTGALYRAVGLKLLRAGQDPEDEDLAAEAARSLADADIQDPGIRTEAAASAASKVAALPRVRQALLDYQRAFARRPGGAVLDGRDIGTVVCPDADVKLYVTASDEVRARRRYDELVARGEQADFETVLEDLRRRDARDSGRKDAPLARADDACLLDTSNLDIEAAFREATRIVSGFCQKS